jgi:hypothetical protein
MSLGLRGGGSTALFCAALVVGCVPVDSGRAPDSAPATPPPTPAPIVLKDGLIPLPGAASVRYITFETPASGRLEITLDWSATGNETDVYPRIIGRSYEGACAIGCEREDGCPSSCRRELESLGELRERPVTYRTEAVFPAGQYEFHVSFYDPLDYLIPYHPDQPPRVVVGYQIVLFPSAP